MNFKELITGNISQDGFAKRVVGEFESKGYPGIYYDGAQFSIKPSDRLGGGVIYLSNFYAEYCKTPRLSRKSMLARIVDERIRARSSSSKAEWDPEKLLTVIREKSYLWFCEAQMAASQVDGDYHINAIPVGDNHIASLVLDSPTQTIQATDQILKSMNLGFEDAIIRAAENLRDISPDTWQPVGSHAYIGAWNDSFDCSRILLPDLIHRLGLPGNPVALLPCRGVLLVTSNLSVEGQVSIFSAAKKIVETNSRWTSAGLIEHKDGRWQTFISSDKLVLRLQHELTVRFCDSAYAQQKVLLDRQLKLENRDIFIASYLAYEKAENLFSATTWSDGVEAWLPKADYLLFVKSGADGENDIVCVTWDTAFDFLSPWMIEVSDVLPTRFHVNDFPSAELIDSLREHQVEMG